MLQTHEMQNPATMQTSLSPPKDLNSLTWEVKRQPYGYIIFICFLIQKIF